MSDVRSEWRDVSDESLKLLATFGNQLHELLRRLDALIERLDAEIEKEKRRA